MLMDGGDVDNAPSLSLFNHMPGGDLRAEKRAIDIHGKNLPPLRKRHINKRGFGHRPGIIDQHVNAPQALDKMFNDLRALG